MTSKERSQYIRAVVKAVYGKEPEEARVTGMDWGVLCTWLDRKDENGSPDPIPLATVLQAVYLMEKHPSIRYIREAVRLEELRRQRALGVGAFP